MKWHFPQPTRLYAHMTITKLVILGFSTILALLTMINIIVLFGIQGIVHSYETIVENETIRSNENELIRIFDNFHYISQFAAEDIQQTQSLSIDNGVTLMSAMLDMDVHTKDIMEYLKKNNVQGNKILLNRLNKNLKFIRLYKSTNDITSMEVLQDIKNGVTSVQAIINNDLFPLVNDTVDTSTEQAKNRTTVSIWIIIGSNLVVFGLVILLVATIRRIVTGHRQPIIETAILSANGAHDVSKYTLANKEAISQVKEVFSEMSRAFENITESTQDSTAGIQKITDSTENAAESLKTLSDQASRIYEYLNQNQTEIQGSETHLLQLRDKINESTNRIQTNAETAAELHNKFVALTNQVEGIDDILKTIDDIKEQTTMLSLNAGIEAARAGEHGRGFEIVAKKIRHLSEQSGQSTSEIHAIIEEIHQAVFEVESAMREVIEGVKNSVEEIAGVSEEFNDLRESHKKVLSGIETLMQQANSQWKATKNIEEASEKITAEVQQISALSEEVYASMEELSAEAENALEQLELVDDNVQRTSEIAVNQELLAKQVNEHVSSL